MPGHDERYEPDIRVRVKLDNRTGHPASVAQIAVALDVYTRLLSNRASPGFVEHAHRASVIALAEMTVSGERLIVSVGGDGYLHSWTANGSPGSLQLGSADDIGALTLVRRGSSSLIVAGGTDGSVRSWRPNGAAGPLQVSYSEGGPVHALTWFRYQGAPVVASAASGALQSWQLDNSEGPLHVRDPSIEGVVALVALFQDVWTVIVGLTRDGALRSWLVNGSPGPLHTAAGAIKVQSLAVASQGRSGYLLLGGEDGSISSWQAPNDRGPFQVEGAHDCPVSALTTVQYESQLLVVSGGIDGSLKTWWPDGTPGPSHAQHAHHGPVRALASLSDPWRPALVSGGEAGDLRIWPMVNQLPSLSTEAAQAIQVRELSLGSLEFLVEIPAALAAVTGGIALTLRNLEEIAGFAAGLSDRLKTRRAREQKELQDAEQALRDTAAAAAYDRRRLEDAGWATAEIEIDIDDPHTEP